MTTAVATTPVWRAGFSGLSDDDQNSVYAQLHLFGEDIKAGCGTTMNFRADLKVSEPIPGSGTYSAQLGEKIRMTFEFLDETRMGVRLLALLKF